MAIDDRTNHCCESGLTICICDSCFGELETALKPEKEAKIVVLHESSSQVALADDAIVTVNYAGQRHFMKEGMNIKIEKVLNFCPSVAALSMTVRTICSKIVLFPIMSRKMQLENWIIYRRNGLQIQYKWFLQAFVRKSKKK